MNCESSDRNLRPLRRLREPSTSWTTKGFQNAVCKSLNKSILNHNIFSMFWWSNCQRRCLVYLNVFIENKKYTWKRNAHKSIGHQDPKIVSFFIPLPNLKCTKLSGNHYWDQNFRNEEGTWLGFRVLSFQIWAFGSILHVNENDVKSQMASCPNGTLDIPFAWGHSLNIEFIRF